MEKGFALLVAALAVASIAGAVLACDDNNGSIFLEEEKDASGEPPPGSFVTDAGSEGGDGGEAVCPPNIPDDYKPEWIAPQEESVCTDDDIEAYYDACIDSLGKDGGAETCRTWTSDSLHETCAGCIEPTNNSGPIQWFKSRFYQTLNIAGCIAVAQDKPAPTDCGASYHASVQCQRDACDACFNTQGATFNDFRACQGAAKEIGACKSYESAIGAACAGYRDPGSPALACFPSSGESQKAHFSRVIGITCK